MKSIKQQFIDLKEGKINQAQFMRNVRMTLPQYITNITSFNDTIKILRNKAILNESDIKDKNQEKLEQFSQYTYKLNGQEVFPELAFFSNILKAELDDNIYNLSMPVDGVIELNNHKGKTGMYTETDIYGIAGDPEAEAERKMVGKDINPVQTPEEKYNVDKRIDQSELNFLKKLYNKTKDENLKKQIDDLEQRMSLNESQDKTSRFAEIDTLNGQEVLIGLESEVQNNPKLTKKEAVKIVIKNLKKNPLYYTMEYLSGVPGTEAKYMNKFKAGSDQMRDVKGNDMVDKTNGMSSPKGIEKIKASANKAKKETNKPEGNIKLMTMVAKTVRGLKKMTPTGEKMKKLSLKEGKEYNGINFEIGDAVTVDPEIAPKVGLEPNKTYTIQSFSETPNSKGLPNSIDVVLDKAKYQDTYLLNPAKGGVNIKYVTKTEVNENNNQLDANKIDPTYTHFALNKNDNKIYNAWEYTDLEPSDIKYYTTMDLKDNDLNPADFKILSIRGMKQKNIDPFDSKNWYSYKNENQINEVKAGSLSIGDDFTLAGDLGKFVKGEKVTVYSITPWGNDLKIMLSNGKDKDDFYIDKNDEL